MHIEIITISRIRFNAEEVFHLFLHCCHVFTFADFFRIKTIAQENQVNTAIVALGSLLQRNDFVFRILIVILRNRTLMSIILVFQFKDNFSGTSF